MNGWLPKAVAIPKESNDMANGKIWSYLAKDSCLLWIHHHCQSYTREAQK